MASPNIAPESIFGPVLSVMPYGDEEEAVRIANDSDLGLTGAGWFSDVQRASAIARRVQSGTGGINGYVIDFLAIRRHQGQRIRSRIRPGVAIRLSATQVDLPACFLVAANHHARMRYL